MRPALLLVLLLPLAAGCLDDPSTDDATVGGPLPGVGDPHDEPTIEETPVETELGAGVWTATRTVTIVNGVAGALSASVAVTNGPGATAATGVEAGAYTIEVVLEASALTEAQARDLLATMSVAHDDDLADGRLAVETSVEYEDVPATLGILHGMEMRSATVSAALPRHLPYALALSAGSGAVSASDLAGSALVLEAGSGEVAARDTEFASSTLSTGSGSIAVQDGRGGALVVEAGSGDLRVEGRFDNVAASTGSGNQEHVLSVAGSGAHRFQAGSGTIAVRAVRAPGQALDVQAQNGSGTIEVRLSDGEPVGPQDEDRVHVRSRGFDEAPTQTTVQLDTGSGDIQFTD